MSSALASRPGVRFPSPTVRETPTSLDDLWSSQVPRWIGSADPEQGIDLLIRGRAGGESLLTSSRSEADRARSPGPASARLGSIVAVSSRHARQAVLSLVDESKVQPARTSGQRPDRRPKDQAHMDTTPPPQAAALAHRTDDLRHARLRLLRMTGLDLSPTSWSSIPGTKWAGVTVFLLVLVRGPGGSATSPGAARAHAVHRALAAHVATTCSTCALMLAIRSQRLADELGQGFQTVVRRCRCPTCSPGRALGNLLETVHVVSELHADRRAAPASRRRAQASLHRPRRRA